MKTIIDSINESTNSNKVEFGKINVPNSTKKFGFTSFDSNSNTIMAFTVNSAKELEAEYSAEDRYFDSYFDLNVAESLTDESGAIVTRIW